MARPLLLLLLIAAPLHGYILSHLREGIRYKANVANKAIADIFHAKSRLLESLAGAPVVRQEQEKLKLTRQPASRQPAVCRTVDIPSPSRQEVCRMKEECRPRTELQCEAAGRGEQRCAVVDTVQCDRVPVCRRRLRTVRRLDCSPNSRNPVTRT